MASTRVADAGSAEDLSEYTDADESISAPTEFLAEFLSAVMLKDYETALKYCKLILQYEPNNATAKEFYPLIVEKLQLCSIEADSDSESESSETDSSSCSCSSSGSSGDGDDNDNDNDNKPSDSDATTASYSSLEDDEADQQNNAIKFSRQFSSTDFTNGNTSDSHFPQRRTSDAKQRLAKAIQRKLQDNQKSIFTKLALAKRRNSLASNMASMTLSSPEDETNLSFDSPISPTGHHLPWPETSPESECFPLNSDIKIKNKSGSAWDEKSPESEISVGFPFSSGSESPSDPYTLVTVQSANVPRN